MSDLSPNVALVDGIPCVSSFEVAQRFDKPHCKVLRSIRAIMAECPQNLREANFGATFRYVTGPNGARRRSPAYNLTRDAFSLVVMGFTGKEALRWKIRYIEAFNAMEKALAEKAAKPKRKALPSAPLPRPALPAAPAQPRVYIDSQTCNKQLRIAADVAQVIRQVEALKVEARRWNAPREFRRTAADTGRAEDRYEIQSDLYRACNAALSAAVAALCASAEVGEWA